MSWREKALEKLEAEQKTARYDKYAQIMKGRVCEALTDFCCQNEEFAQAVAQGGTFEDCMKAVAKGCGTGISDLEAFRRAVGFYFPGADVKFHMTVEFPGGGAQEREAGSRILDLADFW